MHTSDAKRGKTGVRELRLILGLPLIGGNSGVRFFKPIDSLSKAKEMKPFLTVVLNLFFKTSPGVQPLIWK